MQHSTLVYRCILTFNLYNNFNKKFFINYKKNLLFYNFYIEMVKRK